VLYPPSESFWPSLPLFAITIIYKGSFQDRAGMYFTTKDPPDSNIWMVCGWGLMRFEGLEGLYVMG